MDWHTLSHLPIAELRELQNRKLRRFVHHELPFSPFYRELFQKHKLKFSDFRTTEDLQRIPLVSKADLAPTEDDRARPRQFILQPDEHLIKKYAPKAKLLKILMMKAQGKDVKRWLEREYKPIHLHFTTGRTALPTPFAYSERDILTLRETGTRLLDVVGVPRDQVAINGFPYSPHLAFWLGYHAMNALGMTSVQTGGGKIMGTQKIMDAIERMKASLVAFVPGYGYHLLREAAKQKRDFSNVQYVFFGGERLSQSQREKVRELLQECGAKFPQIYATYAMTEGKTAWIQCTETTGYHTYPDLEYFEVVDKEGNRVREGEAGELVYSALDWRGSVVVRYRTGDMIKGISYEPCPHCHKTVPQIYPDIQRSSEVKEMHLTKVKGELVNLNDFYPLLGGTKEIDEWQVTIRKKHNDPFEVDEIAIALALKPGTRFDEISREVQRKISNEMGVTPILEEAKLEDLLGRLGIETELKEKRIVDARPRE